MSTTESFSIESPVRGTLHGLIDYPKQGGIQPAIVVCHGFKGFMEWGFFPYLSRLLADRGFTTVRFNFSGSGMQPGDDRVSDLEAFRQALFSNDVQDLQTILGALDSQIAPGRIDLDRVGLFGHSRGGGIALLTAASLSRSSSTPGPSIRALVTWAAVGTFDRATPQQKADWRRTGAMGLQNTRTGQELSIDVAVLDDLEKHRAQLDPIAAASAPGLAPWLIVHGDGDETVPVHEARELAAGGGEGHELLVIEKASHTFAVGHPFTGPSPQLVEAMNATQKWFRKCL